MRIRYAATLLAAIVLAAGCSNSNNTGPTDPTSGNGSGTLQSTPGVGSFRPLFQYTPLSATTFNVVLPYPTDLFFSGTTDGTLNVPNLGALVPNRDSLNVLDGFSTTESMTARFSAAIDPATIGAQTVIAVEVAVDNATKATVGVRRLLTYGVDYTARVQPTVDSAGSTLEILPLKPLTPSTGATNVGYLVILTSGLKDTAGHAATPDNFYQQIKGALPTCAAFTNATQNGICLLTGAHLQIAGGIGVNPANVVLTFSFSTQSTGDALNVLAAITPPQAIGAMPTGLTVTQASGGAIPGDNADVWVGEIQLPYYVEAPSAANPTAPLTRRWLGNVSPIDATGTSREITRFNPVPVKTGDVIAPLLITVPNPGSPAYGLGKPEGGWPVVIFAPGFTSVRTTMLAIANSYANAGFVVVSMDHPLHGITDPTNPLYVAPDPETGRSERTFDVDYVNNATLAPGPDGLIDPSGINAFGLLLQNPAVFRDVVRQSEADFMALAKSIANLDLDGDLAGDINADRIHWSGISGGSVVGTVVNALPVNIQSAYLNVPGGQFARLLERSPTFGPILRAPLAASGLVPGLTLYDNFWRTVQTVVDSADPLNYIAAAAAARPVLLTQVLNDQTIPNAYTQKLVTAAGLTKASTAGPNFLGAGDGRWVHFVSGGHGSLLDPSADLAVTVEAQTHAVSLAASGGAAFQVVNAALLEP
jgi:hypothetical protein